jgi:sec-independent protein translocase protein TatB
MLGIGMGEMIVIAGIALVVIGPEKFPDFAKVVLKTIRDIRGYVDEVKDEVASELRPVTKEINSLSRIDPESYLDTLTGDSEDDDEEDGDDDADTTEDYSYGKPDKEAEEWEDPYTTTDVPPYTDEDEVNTPIPESTTDEDEVETDTPESTVNEETHAATDTMPGADSREDEAPGTEPGPESRPQTD